MGIAKTNTFKSPLLQPVKERNYTKGLTLDDKGAVVTETPVTSAPAPAPQGPDAAQAPPPPPKGADKPPSPPPGTSPLDETKGFTFDDVQEGKEPGEIGEGDHGQGIGITSASAKTFANFIGNAIQMYLPKFSYDYSKIDIENVIVNIHKGVLGENWLAAFTEINKRTEEGLKISDEAIKMWKSAFKDYLEYKNIKIANPETAFWGATAVLLFDQGLRTYQIKKANEEYMRQALQHDSPNLFIKKQPEPAAASNTPKPEENGERKVA